MRSRKVSSLVSAATVRAELASLRTFDCSWFLDPKRSGKADFVNVGHIPGACFVDIDEVADHSTGLPHMLPSREQFEEAASRWGLRRGDDVVVYDAQFLSSFRVWWMFKKVFGHERVRVLDGGFPAWLAAGFPVEKGEEVPRLPTQYRAAHDKRNRVATILDVVSPGVCVLDARPAARFRGEADEPRPSLKKGHIPGSINIPWTTLHRDPARPELGLHGLEKLREILAPALTKYKEKNLLITSCGSGVSAAMLNFALDELHAENPRLYDGSWAEYGNLETSVVEKS